MGPKVLIIDDSAVVRGLLTRGLSKHGLDVVGGAVGGDGTGVELEHAVVGGVGDEEAGTGNVVGQAARRGHLLRGRARRDRAGIRLADERRAGLIVGDGRDGLHDHAVVALVGDEQARAGAVVGEPVRRVQAGGAAAR